VADLIKQAPCPRSPHGSNCGTCLVGTDNDQDPAAAAAFRDSSRGQGRRPR